MKNIMTFFVASLLSASSVANADLLLDQISAVNPFSSLSIVARASQQFEATNATAHLGVIDDFQYNGQTLTKFEFIGQVYNGGPTTRSWSNVTGFRLEFYSSDQAARANLTGDVASFLFSPSAVTLNLDINPDRAHGVIDFNAILPHSGTTWVGLIPIMNNLNNLGQTGIVDYLGGGTPGNFNSRQANPGGGFFFTGLNLVNQNAAYRLTASAIPEPSGLALVCSLIGIAASGRRRNK